MSKTLTLVTAILMTVATVTWLASALYIPHDGGGAMMRWLIVLAFGVLAAFYWRLYFKRNSADKTGTE